VKLAAVPVVGVPVIVPVVAFSVRPAGKEPTETLKVYGDVPPLAVTVCEYAVPAIGTASVVGATTTVATFTVKLNAWLPLNGAPVPVLLSVALMLKLNGPPAVAVPERTPALESVKPAGNVPEVTEYVYGDVPPDAVSVVVYAVPTVALVSVVCVTDTVGAAITSVSACVPLNGAPVPVLLSVALMLKLKLPAAVGVPERTPLLSVTPAGNDPLTTEKVYGAVPPLAVIVCVYAAATVPAGTVVCVTVTVGAASVKE